MTIFLVTFLIAPLQAWDKRNSGGFIQPGRRISSAIDLTGEQISYSYKTFKIRVADNVFAMDIQIENSPADLDIYVNFDREIANYDEVDFASTLELYNESINLSRMSSVPLQTGVYYIDIVYPLERLPLIGNKESNRIPFGLTVNLETLDEPVVLIPDQPVKSSLSSGEGMMKLFAVDLTGNEEALRIDLFGTTMDLDMYVSHGNIPMSPENADYLRESYLGEESLVIDSTAPRPLKPGRYYISVFDMIEDDLTDEFSIIVSRTAKPPEILMAYPELPRWDTPLDRALYSTVEISTESGSGSGCLVSPRGHIITGLHVITTGSGEIANELYVALNLSPYDPPRVLFKAELIDIRHDEDLAFLKISEGLYGQDLPEGYNFPFFFLAEDRPVKIGQELRFLGYPQIGGEGSRVSISLTRGLVSGFNRTDYGYLIKTDGEINGGNSGGAAFNSSYELVGFPMSVISDDGGQIAYIHPLSLIPEEWMKILGE